MDACWETGTVLIAKSMSGWIESAAAEALLAYAESPGEVFWLTSLTKRTVEGVLVVKPYT